MLIVGVATNFAGVGPDAAASAMSDLFKIYDKLEVLEPIYPEEKEQPKTPLISRRSELKRRIQDMLRRKTSVHNYQFLHQLNDKTCKAMIRYYTNRSEFHDVEHLMIGKHQVDENKASKKAYKYGGKENNMIEREDTVPTTGI